MRRFWVEGELEVGQSFELNKENYHHIIDVCRQKEGSKFELLNSQQKAFFVEIIEVGKKTALVKVLEEREVPSLAKPYIHLCVSVPKLSKLEFILEKSVELGLKSVKPFFSDHSFVRSESKISPSKKERWKKIVVSATQQSGRGELMAIDSPIHLEKLLESFNQSLGTVGLFPYEGVSQMHIKEALFSWKEEPFDDVWIFVGSEGGFSEAEVATFSSQGLKPVTLGQQVLRVETACVAISSVIKYELDLMK